MNKSVVIKINESADELNNNNPGQFKHTPRPPGVNFYSIKWGTTSPGIVKVEQGTHSFSIGSAISVSGSDDPNFSAENILEWDINAGVSDQDLIAHDEARLKFFSILQKIRKAGWTRYIYRGYPRLTKSDAIQFAIIESPVYSLDPDYLPPLREWMTLPDRAIWQFHTEGAYLTLALSRDPGRVDVQQQGAYFIEYTLVSETEELRQAVGPTKRAIWKESLPAQLAQLKADRQKAEDVLARKGVHIDETYSDPPVPVQYQ